MIHPLILPRVRTGPDGGIFIYVQTGPVLFLSALMIIIYPYVSWPAPAHLCGAAARIVKGRSGINGNAP